VSGYVIGIDPSLSETGIATPHETYTIPTKASDPARLDVIHTAVCVAATPPGGVELAVVEDLPTHAHGAGLTGMAQGVVRLALIRHSVPYATVPAASLKKFATGKGNATKPDMRMELFKRTGLDLRNDNEVDAWWLRQIGLHLVGDPDRLSLPQTHLVALEKVKRP
jgi:Holliday junction resolvasome RuvABC endonuclease subunit